MTPPQPFPINLPIYHMLFYMFIKVYWHVHTAYSQPGDQGPKTEITLNAADRTHREAVKLPVHGCRAIINPMATGQFREVI